MGIEETDNRNGATEENKNLNTVNLDKILVEEIGQIGPFQLRILGLSVIVVIFAAWGASEFVFTTARISTRYKGYRILFLIMIK